jgi:transposase/transposase-like protein
MAEVLEIPAGDRRQLGRLAASSVDPHRRVVQAKALLDLADGASVSATARRYGTWPKAVRRWRAKYRQGGVEAVGTIAAGRGRKRRVEASVVEDIVRDTLESVPDDGSTQWSTRAMATRHGVGKDFVAELWRARKIRPWRIDTFKLSTDPDFEAKLVDIVGLYMGLPERAAVFCFDEKTQVQALDRTQPSLPLRPGRAGTMTHDYKRNGTTDLFAALNVATGEVIHDTRRSHKATDVLAFFKFLDAHVPRDLEIHVVLDNLSAHKAEPVQKWLNSPRRKRWHLHFTPTSSSWLNLVERWFAEITNKRIRRGTFGSVRELTDAIDHWVEHWNDNPEPFVWHRTAEEIIAKVQRGRAALHRVTKSATDD